MINSGDEKFRIIIFIAENKSLIIKLIMDVEPICGWFESFKCDPLFIIGPCSAESEEQLLSVARELNRENKPALMRAGIWKPRTRPGSFSGVGARGLKWLSRVKEETGIRAAVETASPKHVEACLKAGIDVIWIGARTVSNPFSVQEIAESLKGVDIPVLVKNPMNPDIDLWIGAIERISSTGIRKMAAVHRGFSPFERTRFRNIPKWEIPIELKRRFANLPVICDPSHISGDSRLIYEISQKAMDLNMDGLMIEVHNDPSSALSDNAQQLTYVEYRSLMEKLVIRRSKSDDPGFLNYLEELRNQVDSVDQQMVELLARRMELSDMMGEYKCTNNVAVLQMERWLEILRTRLEQAKLAGLDHAFTEKFLKHLHQESIRRQTLVMRNMNGKADCSTDQSPGD